MTMTLISTATVGAGGVTSITFSSIPQDGTDLMITLSWRGAPVDANISFNGSTTGYTGRVLNGTGTAVQSFTHTYNIQNAIELNTYTANTFSNGIFYIPNYISSNAKGYSFDNVWENNAAATNTFIDALNWTGTAAITSIVLTSPTSLLIDQYSTVSLYKITKGSDGITVVT